MFYIDPRKGLKGLQKVLKLPSCRGRIDGIDIAHLGGTETVGSLVCFIDGMPFKPGYRRYKIKSVGGVDDYASIREVVSRRVRSLRERDEPPPDILLIDGGKGQLNAALDAFEALGRDAAGDSGAGEAAGGDLSARAIGFDSAWPPLVCASFATIRA